MAFAPSLAEAPRLWIRRRTRSIAPPGGSYPSIAFSTNASAGELEVELAYDDTPGLARREFFQRFLPGGGDLTPGRNVPVAATDSLIRTVLAHSDSGRLTRGIAQYHQALTHWLPGRETLAVEHLWLGVEAITKAAVRFLCEENEVDESGLARLWGIQGGLEPEVRLRFVFQNDTGCYTKAKKASDGFEHGFMTFPEIYSRAVEVRDQTASYLRSAILRISCLEEGVRLLLLSEPYDKPLPSWEHSRELRGHLIGSADTLAAEGEGYPTLKWTSRIKALSLNESGDYLMTMFEEAKPRLGRGISFQPETLELWAPPSAKPRLTHLVTKVVPSFVNRLRGAARRALPWRGGGQ